MKFSRSFLSDYLRPREPDYGAVAAEAWGAPPPVPLTPVESLDAFLADLIAEETEARARHDAAVQKLNSYIEDLENRLATHQESIKALYAKARPQINAEKVK